MKDPNILLPKEYEVQRGMIIKTKSQFTCIKFKDVNPNGENVVGTN